MNNNYRKRKYYKRRRLSFKKLLKLIIPLVVVVAAVLIIVSLLKREPVVETNEKYLASTTYGVSYYVFDEEEDRLIKSSSTLPRGIVVTDLNKEYTENGRTYSIIEYDGEKYYVLGASLVDSMEEVVTETERWVRTSATVYKEKDDIVIASQAKKGTKLEVLGYDTIKDDGSINMYKVNFTDNTGENVTGWIYGKYLAASEEDALAVNTEIYEIHKNRIYQGRELYGGDPKNLDWWPVEKPHFEDNEIVDHANGMYIAVTQISDMEEYLKIAKETKVDLLVIDIKDGVLGYECEAIKEMSPKSYRTALSSAANYAKYVKMAKDAGFYIVGRIVTFNDVIYGYDNPDECIDSESATQLWPSVYSRACWEFNLTLALDAIELCGFDEIQFDYLRFPEEAYSMSASGEADFRNKYDEEKAEAVQQFCYYAADVLHSKGVYMSADVFGECSGLYVTAYGQYYPAISLVVDAISAMPYPDHFDRSEDIWTDPYPTLYNWAVKTAKRQSEIPNPAIARTWVTAYDVPFWNQTKVCDAQYIMDEVQGLYDGGLTGGFITWNGLSSLSKYRLIQDAWNVTYQTQEPRAYVLN